MQEWTEGDRRNLHLSVTEDGAPIFDIIPCPAEKPDDDPRECHVLIREKELDMNIETAQGLVRGLKIFSREGITFGLFF